MFKLGNVLSKEVHCKITYHRRGMGAEPPPAGGYGGLGSETPSRWAIFRNFLENKAILIPLDHISHVFRAI